MVFNKKVDTKIASMAKVHIKERTDFMVLVLEQITRELEAGWSMHDSLRHVIKKLKDSIDKL